MSSQYNIIQANVLRVLEPAALGDRTSRIWDLSLFSLVVLNLIAVALESVPTLQMSYGTWLYNFELFSVVVFSVEYIARVWSAPAKRGVDFTDSPLKSRVRYIFSFYGLIDLVAILPFYIQALFPGLDLRVLRALRLLRILKLNHYNSALDDLFGAIVEEKKSFVTTLYIFSVAFVLSSSLIYYAEHKVQPEDFRSIPDAMYWSIITLTTVGYGDVSPITVFGKGIAAITAIFGVVVVALLTGIVANAFNKQMERRKIIFEDQVRDALLDGVLDSDEEASLDALRKKFGMSKSQADALIDHVKKLRDEQK
ncbi:ion transporter [Paracoccaceae bacterium]|jgi:voltage-gated potassium channel|nr:ion transporter [Paracoccaceae bacterium]MDG0986136.1 ion transporter [Paracoccaceae bacterium]MDG1676129.1 ion transporter [Paracoccaceae bacterium]|tara:strand:+ start:520 stop:1449 length:930 start_codon:yes stop_codon:yes gene_type:complete